MVRQTLYDENIFAISKSRVFNPLFPDNYGVLYTKHFIKRGTVEGVGRWWIVDVELPQKEALRLIKQYSMKKVVDNEDGVIWDTRPSLRGLCKKLRLKYSRDLRKF